jgi:WD40 repeat protein
VRRRAWATGAALLAAAQGGLLLLRARASWAFEGVAGPHEFSVHSAATGPKGRYRAVVGADGAPAVVEEGTGARVSRFAEHADVVTFVGFAPTGDRVVSTDLSGVAFLWNPFTGGALRRLELGTPLFGAAFSASGRFLICFGEAVDVPVVDTHTGERAGLLVGHRDAIVEATWSPDGRALATASWDGTVRVWEPRSLELQTVLDLPAPVDWVRFTEDGDRIVTGRAERAWVWSRTFALPWRARLREPAVAGALGCFLLSAAFAALSARPA